MNIVILAAGQGKRMRSTLPKVLHPIAGKPMLGWVLDTASALDPKANVVVVVGHGSSQVESYLNSISSAAQIVVQKEQKGTGHAVLQAVPALRSDDQTLILYGDVPLISASTLQKLALLAQQGSLGLLTEFMDDPTGYGRIVRNADTTVAAIVEEKDASPELRAIREVNTGLMIAPTATLKTWLSGLSANNAQQEYYLTDIIEMAVRDGVPVITTQAQYSWETAGVNSKKQLADLECAWQNHLAQALLEQGVTVMDPHRIDIRGELSCEEDVTIDVGCIFIGRVQLARGVRIGPYCVIQDAVIGENVTVEAFSHIQEATIGAESKIGPYARLRPGAQLGEDVHIGNFVEVKKTTIDDGSKANHLAYLGDAQIGKGVNVGAGTITCNYDGANKHLTIIEDGAFIGSDTQLVAPVRVGKNATLGAGTTLTKDAPENQLTVTRVKQTSLHWQRPVKTKK